MADAAKVKFYAFKTGDPSAVTVTLRLLENSSGDSDPNNSSIVASGTIAGSAITTGLNTVTFSAAYTLVSGKNYFVSAQGTNGDASNNVSIVGISGWYLVIPAPPDDPYWASGGGSACSATLLDADDATLLEMGALSGGNYELYGGSSTSTVAYEFAAAKAINPTPSDGAIDVDTSTPFTLSWENGDESNPADSFVVYIGSSLSQDSYETSDTSLTYTGHLYIPSTTWRVDSIYGSVTATGDEWTFTPALSATARWRTPYGPTPLSESTIGPTRAIECLWKGDYRSDDYEVWMSVNGATATKVDSPTSRRGLLTGLTYGDSVTWHVKEELKLALLTTVFFWIEGPEWTFTVGSSVQMTAQGNRANYETLTRVWLSTTGDYDTFDEGTNDDDAFSLVIATQNEVRWIGGIEALLLATSADEWQIASNKLDTPLSPTNFGIKKQSNYGSRNIQPIRVNEVLLFADFVGRKIREMTYSTDTDKYVAPDLTALAENVTETGIVCMAHQKNPDSMLWCVLSDGSLISMVYNREQNVIAWSDHPIDGTVQSVCVVPGTDEDEVWISVTRTINSSDVVYIEKMATRIQGDIEDSFFVDSGITDTGTSTTITGLDHLEGETVAALVDGVYDGTFTVSSGSITLTTTPVSQTIVGLPFTALLQPMRIVTNDPTGSSLASNTRIHSMKVNFLNTEGAQFGSSTSSLYSFDFDDERLENNDYVTGLFSGDVPVRLEGGFSMENPIYISSSQPFPMSVKTIVATFERTGR